MVKLNRPSKQDHREGLCLDYVCDASGRGKYFRTRGSLPPKNATPDMSLLRFHWDFFGPDAPVTATHFLKHMDEFCTREGVVGYQHWTKAQPAFTTATLECDEIYLALVRDLLRPKRAERVL